MWYEGAYYIQCTSVRVARAANGGEAVGMLGRGEVLGAIRQTP